MAKSRKGNNTNDLVKLSFQTLTSSVDKFPGDDLAPIQESFFVIPKDLREITIVIQNYSDIGALYGSTKIHTKCQHLDQDLGQTDYLLLTDDPLQILEPNKFTIICDLNSTKDLDAAISNPVLFSIFQTPTPSTSLSALEEISELTHDRLSHIVESALSLYEAFTGDTVQNLTHASKSRDRTKTTKKDKVKSSSTGKESQKSSDKKGAREAKKKIIDPLPLSPSSELEPILIGSCTLDLLPLFCGTETEFSETLLVNLAEKKYDEKMISHKFPPAILVSASINKTIDFSCKPTFMGITIESIYNLPELMNDSMEYEVCIILPSANTVKTPIVIKDGEFKSAPLKAEHKYWPNLPKNHSNVSKYRSQTFDSEFIKNLTSLEDLQETLQRDAPRIEFNVFKRIMLLKETFLALIDHIRKYRRAILEIHIKKKRSMSEDKLVKGRGKKKVSDNSDKLIPNQLHLMTVVDLSSLLYPGVQSVRVACPISVFHEEEATTLGGLVHPYFNPSLPKPSIVLPPRPVPLPEPQGKELSEIESKKSSKMSKSKSGKSKSGKSKASAKKVERIIDLKEVFPPEPEAPTVVQPSLKIFNENGEPTFIIVEIALTHPIMGKRDVDDLQNELKQMVHEKTEKPKSVLGLNVAMEFSRKMIEKIICEMNEYYVKYTEEKKECHCTNPANFIMYLKRSGIYHNFVYSLTQASTAIVQNHDSYDRKFPKKLAEDMFMHLIREMNGILNKITVNSIVAPRNSTTLNELLLFYAKEAMELGNEKQAENYYLKRLYNDSNNPDFWFDYAIFQIDKKRYDKAMICLQKALAINLYHKYSLLLHGFILANRSEFKEAETCLLTVMVHEPRWVEGWLLLHIFYKTRKNLGGMEWCLEMAQKYENDPRIVPDYFSDTDDLAWSTNIIPKTLLYRAAILLLKLRLHSWVEYVLIDELLDTGMVHYILAICCYYQNDYNHAVEHLEKARYFHGSDTAVVCLEGHCHVALGNFKKAEEDYLHTFESFERPDYIHLLYIQLAKITENLQEARKLYLIACKNRPTPYTWTLCGIVFFQQNDLLSAEECFSEAIYLNSILPEAWAYLTLINLKLKHVNEAEICYKTAIKNHLEDKDLLGRIEEGFRKLSKT